MGAFLLHSPKPKLQGESPTAIPPQEPHLVLPAPDHGLNSSIPLMLLSKRKSLADRVFCARRSESLVVILPADGFHKRPFHHLYLWEMLRLCLYGLESELSVSTQAFEQHLGPLQVDRAW